MEQYPEDSRLRAGEPIEQPLLAPSKSHVVPSEEEGEILREEMSCADRGRTWYGYPYEERGRPPYNSGMYLPPSSSEGGGWGPPPMYRPDGPPPPHYNPHDARCRLPLPPTTRDGGYPYYPQPTESMDPREIHNEAFRVSMDENSPGRTSHEYPPPPKLHSPSSHPSSHHSHPEYPPLNTPSRVMGPYRHYPPTLPPNHEGKDYYIDQLGPSPTTGSYPPPPPPPSGGYPPDSPYRHHHYHAHRPPTINVHDPYEPHPHDMPFPRVDYSTPPPNSNPHYHSRSDLPLPPHISGKENWDARTTLDQDVLPATVSHESEMARHPRAPSSSSSPGGKSHQFRRGARSIHSEPIILRKKFSWRNYPEVR